MTGNPANLAVTPVQPTGHLAIYSNSGVQYLPEQSSQLSMLQWLAKVPDFFRCWLVKTQGQPAAGRKPQHSCLKWVRAVWLDKNANSVHSCAASCRYEVQDSGPSPEFAWSLGTTRSCKGAEGTWSCPDTTNVALTDKRQPDKGKTGFL